MSVNPGNSNNTFKLLSVFALSELWYNLLLDGGISANGCGKSSSVSKTICMIR